MRSALLPLVGCALGLAGCQREAAPAPAPATVPAAPSLREVDVPAPPGARFPMLAAAGDGGLLLGWTEPAGSGHRLRFAARRSGTWSEPQTIAEGGAFFVNWADTPSLLALPDGRLAAHWLEKTGRRGYDYAIRLVTSADGGKTWSKPIAPHRDGVDAEHGFVSLFPQGERLGIVWLDGRAMASGHGHGDGATALRHATLDADGTLSEERVIDDRVCDCCQTAAAVSGRRVVVAYRDRGEDERRDVSVARLEQDAWSAPADLSRDGWIMPACPVNGPQLAARGDSVAAVWFTAAGGTGRVRFALSSDGGATFGRAADLDADAPLGRVDVEWLPSGDALATWMRPLPPKSGRIIARRLGTSGATGEEIVVGETGGARSSGFPRLAVAGDEAFIAWTDTAGDAPRLRLAALPAR